MLGHRDTSSSGSACCCWRLQGWNNVTIELWTHERNGLSENDFIVAAKIDEVLAQPDVAQLLSKKQPEL